MSPTLLSLLALAAPVHAGSVAVVVELTEEGPRILDATLVGGGAQHLPPGGDLVVEAEDGSSLAGFALPEALWERSVVLPEGGGEGVVLEASLVRLRLDWPEAAARVRLGAERRVPSVRPPAPDGAVEVSVSGDADERLDMLFLAEGYTADELDTFADDVESMAGYLMAVPPYDAYTGLVNVWRVDSVSNVSGAGESGAPKDTAYGCYYYCGGIERLLCCTDSKVISAINTYLPDADGVLVAVNSSKYGGAGGTTYGTSYNGTYAQQVASHEIGHSLIGLWDEYSYGYSGSGADGPNCSSDGTGGAWEQWLDVEGVDAYEVCSYTNYYRPTNNSCMMNSLQDQYCPVCREQVVQQIYKRLPALITGAVPEAGEVSMDPEGELAVSASVLGPDDGSMAHTWLVDGVEVDSGTGATASLELSGCTEDFELTLAVSDPTEHVRVDPSGHLDDSLSWSVSCGEGGGSGSGEEGSDDGVSDDTGGDEGGAGVGGVGDGLDEDDDGDISTSRCGCAATGGPAGLALLLPVLLGAARRRSDRGAA